MSSTQFMQCVLKNQHIYLHLLVKSKSVFFTGDSQTELHDFKNQNMWAILRYCNVLMEMYECSLVCYVCKVSQQNNMKD